MSLKSTEDQTLKQTSNSASPYRLDFIVPALEAGKSAFADYSLFDKNEENNPLKEE